MDLTSPAIVPITAPIAAPNGPRNSDRRTGSYPDHPPPEASANPITPNTQTKNIKGKTIAPIAAPFKAMERIFFA